ESYHSYEPDEYHTVHFGNILHNERYRILHKVGYGRNATVWAARDEQKGLRCVAIKIFKASARPNRETGIMRILAANRTKHPGLAHIPVLLDEFELVGPNGTDPCIVTDIYGGRVVPDSSDSSAEYTASTASRLQKQVLQAVDCLHQHGIVH
ncbi:hypothetical protein K470DRAFT_194830, partial [Piedraia hortae CBS 480.64]